MSTPRTSSGPRAASGLAAGSVLAGVLAYAFFAASTRALGAADAAPVAVLWSYWGFAAAGLTFPVQHWITRTAATAGEYAVRAAWEPIGGIDVEDVINALRVRPPASVAPLDCPSRPRLRYDPDSGELRLWIVEGRPDDVRDRVRTSLAEAFRPYFDGTGVAVPGGFMIVTARR